MVFFFFKWGATPASNMEFFVEGGGPKLGFGDENPEIDLWLDSPSLLHVRSIAS